MKGFWELNRLLKCQKFHDLPRSENDAVAFARAMATMENVVAVVSDLRRGKSRIFAGAFAHVLGLDNYSEENSIWEKDILSLMSPFEQEAKFLAELRFFNQMRRLAPWKRSYYYLVSRLRFNISGGEEIDVLHRMYYIYEGYTVGYAICLYGPMPSDFIGRSVIVNSVTGTVEELKNKEDDDILSRREKQVLSLISRGRTSADIAAELGISIHTVSRHRQDILGRLRAVNSYEACRIARSLGIL